MFCHSNENMPGLACCKVRITGTIVPLPDCRGYSQLNAWYMSIPGPNEPLSYAYPKSLNCGIIIKVNDYSFYVWVLRCVFTQYYCSNGYPVQWQISFLYGKRFCSPGLAWLPGDFFSVRRYQLLGYAPTYFTWLHQASFKDSFSFVWPHSSVSYCFNTVAAFSHLLFILEVVKCGFTLLKILLFLKYYLSIYENN